jgi:hypothetical protein
VISLSLVLAELRLGLKNCQVGEKWVSDDCSYLCKGLIKNFKQKAINVLPADTDLNKVDVWFQDETISSGE